MKKKKSHLEKLSKLIIDEMTSRPVVETITEDNIQLEKILLKHLGNLVEDQKQNKNIMTYKELEETIKNRQKRIEDLEKMVSIILNIMLLGGSSYDYYNTNYKKLMDKFSSMS